MRFYCNEYELQNSKQYTTSKYLCLRNCAMSYHDSTSAPRREKHLSSGGIITLVI
jgi:hypothetical protein